MAQRPQGCKTTVCSIDTTIVATSINNKNVYGVTVVTDGAVVGEQIILRDSDGGTIRWRGRVEIATGTRHYDFGRYGINFPAGVYLQLTGESSQRAVTVIWD